MLANACRNSAYPYGLRFPEDLATCNLVTQAVIGHEDRSVVEADTTCSLDGPDLELSANV